MSDLSGRDKSDKADEKTKKRKTKKEWKKIRKTCFKFLKKRPKTVEESIQPGTSVTNKLKSQKSESESETDEKLPTDDEIKYSETIDEDDPDSYMLTPLTFETMGSRTYELHNESWNIHPYALIRNFLTNKEIGDELSEKGSKVIVERDKRQNNRMENEDELKGNTKTDDTDFETVEEEEKVQMYHPQRHKKVKKFKLRRFKFLRKRKNESQTDTIELENTESTTDEEEIIEEETLEGMNTNSQSVFSYDFEPKISEVKDVDLNKEEENLMRSMNPYATLKNMVTQNTEVENQEAGEYFLQKELEYRVKERGTVNVKLEELEEWVTEEEYLEEGEEYSFDTEEIKSQKEAEAYLLTADETDNLDESEANLFGQMDSVQNVPILSSKSELESTSAEDIEPSTSQFETVAKIVQPEVAKFKDIRQMPDELNYLLWSLNPCEILENMWIYDEDGANEENRGEEVNYVEEDQNYELNEKIEELEGDHQQLGDKGDSQNVKPKKLHKVEKRKKLGIVDKVLSQIGKKTKRSAKRRICFSVKGKICVRPKIYEPKNSYFREDEEIKGLPKADENGEVLKTIEKEKCFENKSNLQPQTSDEWDQQARNEDLKLDVIKGIEDIELRTSKANDSMSSLNLSDLFKIEENSEEIHELNEGFFRTEKSTPDIIETENTDDLAEIKNFEPTTSEIMDIKFKLTNAKYSRAKKYFEKCVKFSVKEAESKEFRTVEEENSASSKSSCEALLSLLKCKMEVEETKMKEVDLNNVQLITFGGMKKSKEELSINESGITLTQAKSIQYGVSVFARRLEEHMVLVNDRMKTTGAKGDCEQEQETLANVMKVANVKRDKDSWRLEEKGYTGFFSDGLKRIDMVFVVLEKEDPQIQEIKAQYILNLCKAGLELEFERGLLQDNRDLMFIKVHTPDLVLMKYAEAFGAKKFFADVHLDFVKLSLLQKYIGVKYEKEWLTIVRRNYIPRLRHSTHERSYITYMLMRNIAFGPFRNHIGLERLLEREIVLDAYALHDGPYFFISDQRYAFVNTRQILFYNWVGVENTLTFQPINLIHEYFGSKIAFYFAFYECYNKALFILAVGGIVITFFQLSLSDPSDKIMVNKYCKLSDASKKEVVCPRCRDFHACPFTFIYEHCPRIYLIFQYLDNVYFLVYSLMSVFFSILFVKYWRRTEKFFIWLWELRHSKHFIVRPQFESSETPIKSNLTGLKYDDNPLWNRCGRNMCSLCIFLFCGVVLILVVLLGLFLKYDALKKDKLRNDYVKEIRNFDSWKPHRLSNYFQNWYSTLSLYHIFTLIVLLVLEKIFRIISRYTTRFENHRKHHAFENSLILKDFSISVGCSLLPLMFFGWIKGTLYRFPYWDWFPNSTYIGHFIHMNCNPLTCLDEVLVVYLMTFAVRIIALRVRSFIYKWDRTDFSITESELQVIPAWEREYLLKSVTEDTVNHKFNALAIQFALLTWFGAVFPLAPAIAWVINIFHLRNEAKELLLLSRRAVLFRADGIGAWNGVLAFVAYVSPFASAVLLVTQTSLVQKYMFKKLNHINQYYAKDWSPVYNWARFNTSWYLEVPVIKDHVESLNYTQEFNVIKECYFYGIYTQRNTSLTPLPYPFDTDRRLNFSHYVTVSSTYRKPFYDLAVIVLFEILALLVVILCKYYIRALETNLRQIFITEKMIIRTYRLNFDVDGAWLECPYSQCDIHRKPGYRLRNQNYERLEFMEEFTKNKTKESEEIIKMQREMEDKKKKRRKKDEKNKTENREKKKLRRTRRKIETQSGREEIKRRREEVQRRRECILRMKESLRKKKEKIQKEKERVLWEERRRS